jgi:hypothetical protein
MRFSSPAPVRISLSLSILTADYREVRIGYLVVSSAMIQLRIVYRRVPSGGKHIPEQKCEYFKAPDGLPAINCRWEGLFFGREEREFVFARDSVGVARVSDSTAKFQAGASTFMKASSYGMLTGGIIGSLVAGAVGAAATNKSAIKGFAVSYVNEKQSKGYFIAIAPAHVVDEIFASLPPEKIRPDDDTMR